ncbi:hypothetical protein DKT75_10545 [Leucothrix arctica]|uniref:Uncharacterized protein n=2 Tax=Leucothrix arctica TaxID=1481894 RepID=A0A317CJB0_9GAMM|nr:hypothetical protein DKT75_10545 [Leucothrix arctica]
MNCLQPNHKNNYWACEMNVRNIRPLINQLILFSTLLLASHSAFSAGPTFVCDGTAYPTFGSNPTTLQQMDKTTLAVTDIATVDPSGTINATGYNILDNYIYGLQGSNFYRLSADGTYEILGQPTGVGTATGVTWAIGVNYAGTMDASGNWYGHDTDYVYIVSIGSNPAAGSLTFERLARSGTFTGKVADLAFNPLDGNLYGMSGGNLRKITAAGVGSTVTTAGVGLSGSAGGAWSTSSGTLYFYNNGSGLLYSVDMTQATPLVAFVGNVPSNGTFDATACTPAVLSKSVSEESVSIGEAFTYTFTLINPLSTPLTVDFEDNIPAGLNFVLGTLSTTTPGGGTVSTYTTDSLLIDDIVIPSGLSPANEVTFTVQAVANDVSALTSVANQAEITYGANTSYSNDPDTSDIDDPTVVSIHPNDWGDAPTNMQSIDDDLDDTYGDAWHTLYDTIYLGSLIDSETGSQNTGLDADGDDMDGSDDDDGVVFPVVGTTSVLRVDRVNTITVTASVDGYLNAWIDWNQDGDWDDSGEQVATNTALTAGSNAITVTPSIYSPHGETYSRFRFTSESVATPSALGGMDDGEVEDYTVHLMLPPPSDDACSSVILNTGFEASPNPSTFIQPAEDLVEGWATIPDSPTSSNSFARRNAIELWKTGFLGVPSYDGTYFAELNAYVPGMLYQDVELIPGSNYTWSFAHRARSGSNTLNVLMGHPDSMVLQGTYTSDTSAWKVYTGTYVVPAGQHITRFGFQAVGSSSTGNFLDAAKIPGGCDFGDAPDTYGTTDATNGAHHISNSLLYLGNVIGDSEIDGQPTVAADGDNIEGGNDEDGVSVISELTTNDRTYSVDVVVTNQTGNNARLIAWLDFDGSGTFDADEAALRTIVTGVTASTVTVSWSAIPADIQAGQSYIRVRLTTESISTLEPTGLKEDGEVEDYPIMIVGTTVSGRVYIDVNSNASEDSGESGIGGTVVVLRDTNTGVCRSVLTSGSGDYSFNGVVDGDYEIYQAHGETTPVPQSCGTTSANNPTGYQSTTDDVLTITVVGVDVTDQDFGEVAGAYGSSGYSGFGITFEPNHQSEILPGNVTFYAHVFTSEADGDVSFDTVASGNIATGWSHIAYQDSDCSGSLDAVEAAALNADVASFSVTAGSRICIINKVYSPANAPAQDRYLVETTATFSFSNGTLANETLTTQDLTIVSQSDEASGLELRKTVENTAQNTAETESMNQAKSGDTLKYRIYYRNTGTGPIYDLVVNDSVPAYTSLVGSSASCDSTPASLVNCVPTENSSGAIDWNFVGVLNGGESGSVSYEVTVDN